MKKIPYLFGCLFIYLIFGLAVAVYTRKLGNLFFVWNVFLALLPLLFSRMLAVYATRQKKSRVVMALLALLWLVFFPNAPYMITDLIYTGGSQYYTQTGSAGGYTTNIFAWVSLIYIGLGVIFSALAGTRSQFDIHMLVIRRFGKPAGTAVMAAVCLLGGFGIYIGRILRFNSWDILRPLSLFLRLKENFSSFSVLYSLLLAAYIAATYILFYLVVTAGRKSPASNIQL